MSAAPVIPVRCCENCGTPLAHRVRTNGKPESPAEYRLRRYCSPRCSNRAQPRGAIVTRFPTPTGSFARGYRRALKSGVDPLEALDAAWECPVCGRLPGECEHERSADA